MGSRLSIEYDSHDWNTQQSLNYQYFFFPKGLWATFWENIEMEKFRKFPLR